MIDKDLKELTRCISVNNASHTRDAELLKGTVSQLMLMLANSGAFKDGSPLPAALRELNEQFTADLARNAHPVSSMQALFSGRGPVARRMHDAAALLEYAGVIKPEFVSYTAPDAYNAATGRKIFSALGKFNFQPEQLPQENHPFAHIIEKASRVSKSFVTTKFSPDPGDMPVEVYLTRDGLGSILTGNYQSGMYAGFGRGPHSPLSSTMILRIKSKMYLGLTCVLVKHETANAHLFFHHPYEDFWIQWDGTSYFPHLQEELEMELVKVMAAANPLIPDDTFVNQQTSLRNKVLGLFQVAHKLPPRDTASIPSYEGGPDRLIGDFSWQHNTARVGAICGDAVLVLYGSTLSDGKWTVMCNVIRPAMRGVEIIEPIDPSKLDKTQQDALIQAAHFVIDHWTMMAKKSK